LRSSDIAARCREIALRVECSGEWGELAETLREAAAEVERLRLTGREVRAIRAVLCNTGVQDNDVVAIESILKRQGGGE